MQKNNVVTQKKATNLFFVLDNVYDTYNIGAFFRLADAVGVKELILCGISETPPNTKISRSSRGMDKYVKWRYFEETIEAVKYLKENHNALIYSVEITQDAKIYTQIDYPYQNIALVFGSETYGIKPEVIKSSDAVIKIPMFGRNCSLNVVVSAGIISYHILNAWKHP